MTPYFLLREKIEGYGGGRRVRGEAKKDRDLLVYALWQLGLFRNEEIGQAFGISYSAVSHIVGETKEMMKKDPRIGGKVERINSQFRM